MGGFGFPPREGLRGFRCRFPSESDFRMALAGVPIPVTPQPFTAPIPMFLRPFPPSNGTFVPSLPGIPAGGRVSRIGASPVTTPAIRGAFTARSSLSLLP